MLNRPCIKITPTYDIYYYGSLDTTRGSKFRISHQRLVDRKDILGLENIRLIARTKDLLLLALPLGVVDAVDPVLDLQDDAAVLLNDAGATFVALGGLDGEGSWSFCQ